MSTSFSVSNSTTFTLTHAKKIAAKVATDLKRIQRFYNSPSDSEIQDYEAEITALLIKGYLGTVTYGFQNNGQWIEPTLRFTASGIDLETNDDPGKIRPGKDTAGAYFNSYLTYSSKWAGLTQKEKDDFKKSLPFQRTSGNEPSINGYLEPDKTYSAGGCSLSRSTVRSLK